MNRFDQLPQDLKIKIYEYNADHRPQWKDVMRNLIMYDADLFMEWLREPGEYTSQKLAKAYESTFNLMDMNLITWKEYRNTSYKIVKKCKELYSDEYLCTAANPFHSWRRYWYAVEFNCEWRNHELDFYRFKNLPYRKPHVIETIHDCPKYLQRQINHQLNDDCNHTCDAYVSVREIDMSEDMNDFRSQLLDNNSFVLHIGYF